MKESQRVAHPVTVFGAGIAGLTAAHELAVRGFKVQVIDPDFNEELYPRQLEDRLRTPRPTWMTLDRGIGGMARSQWAVWPTTERPQGLTGLFGGKKLLFDKAIRFRREPDAQGCAVPVDAQRANDLIDRFVEARKAVEGAGALPQQMTIRYLGARDDSGALRRTFPGPTAMRAYFEHELTRRGVTPFDFIDEWTGELDEDTAYFVVLGEVFAAEHGFRFFPSFYRHLFDTMRRTRILAPRDWERTRAAVFENLVPADGLGFARAGASHAFMVPRRAITSFEAIRKIIKNVYDELGYTPADVARFQTKLFKYMTSSSRRRELEYEHMSWGEFLESSRYSPISREHIEYGPQMSAALRGSRSDARTQGNITVQLLLDQFKSDAKADYLLAGPTSGMWFDHWHDFLVNQGVTFHRGRLIGFDVLGDRVAPRVEGAPVLGSYFVLALSLPAMTRLAGPLRDALRTARPAEDVTELDRVLAFAGDLEDLTTASPAGPLQHLAGIQYYFDEDVRFWRGHTQYLDSAWGLTSIAQSQFWARERRSSHPYRSILSVDIGIFDRAFDGKTAWDCTPDEIAERAWCQIRDHHTRAFAKKYGETATFPTPIAYALDACIETVGGTRRNDATFLVNRTGAYPRRPGAVNRESGTARCISRYSVVAGQYVIAGTFMQTFTRLTSMEAANESARHAVNALLQAWNVGGDRCEIWDPEEMEVEDLQWFKDLDEQLIAKRLPHFVDILGLRELPESLGSDHLRLVAGALASLRPR